MKGLYKVTLAASALLFLASLISGLILYFHASKELPDINTIIKLTDYYSDSKGSQINLVVAPTKDTLPDRKYKIALNHNNIVTLKFYVQWSQLEKDIQKSKTTSVKISPDESTALHQNPDYSVTILQVIPTHNILFLFIPLPFLALTVWLGIKYIRYPKSATQTHSIISPTVQYCEDIIFDQPLPQKPRSNQNNIHNILQNALETMSTTHGFFTNEDEANRELTTSLKILGHDARYKYKLPPDTWGKEREADVFFNNSIVEGKLDLRSQDETDRLIGQTLSYLEYPYKVHIVLFGETEHRNLNRIKDFASQHSDRVYLNYLSSTYGTNRVRQSNRK